MLNIFDEIQRIVEHIQQNTEVRENWQNPGDKLKILNIDLEDDIEKKFEFEELWFDSFFCYFIISKN